MRGRNNGHGSGRAVVPGAATLAHDAIIRDEAQLTASSPPPCPDSGAPSQAASIRLGRTTDRGRYRVDRTVHACHVGECEVELVMWAQNVLLVPLDTLTDDVQTLVSTVCVKEARHSDSETADAAADVEDVGRRGQSGSATEGFQQEFAAGGEIVHPAGKPLGFG